MEDFSPDTGEEEFPRLSLRDDDDRLVNHASYLKKMYLLVSLVLKICGGAIGLLKLLYNSEICFISFLLNTKSKSKEVIICFTFKPLYLDHQ